VNALDNDGMSVLHYALYPNMVYEPSMARIVTALLDAGAFVNDARNSKKITPLHHYGANHLKILIMLVRYGASLKLASADGVKAGAVVVGSSETPKAAKKVRSGALLEATKLRHCYQCGSIPSGPDFVPFKRCTGSKTASYCSVECQLTHWRSTHHTTHLAAQIM
jgi:hypothetical protein